MSDPQPDNLCLTVPLAPPPTNDGVLTHQTLLDMIKTMGPLPKLPWADHLGKIAPAAFKPSYLSPSWAVGGSIQAQNRLHRSQHAPPAIYQYDVLDTLPSIHAPLYDVKAQLKRYDEMINRAMLGKGNPMVSMLRHDRDRPDYPDTTAGLEEAMRLDAEYNVDFGLVINDQNAYDAEVIERWIWGPNGEFTGFPAGDDAFGRTWSRCNPNRGEVAPLEGFDRFQVLFDFRPRYTREQMRTDPYIYQDYLSHSQYRTRRAGPYMVRFHTYSDQAQWAKLARHQAMEMMNNGMRGQSGGF